MSVSPRLLALVGLLAMVPVALFALGRSAPEVVLSLVCVLLIVGSLVVMFSPLEEPRHGRAE